MDHSSCDCSITSTLGSRNDNYNWEQFAPSAIKTECPAGKKERGQYICGWVGGVFLKMPLDYCVSGRWDILHRVIKGNKMDGTGRCRCKKGKKIAKHLVSPSLHPVVKPSQRRRCICREADFLNNPHHCFTLKIHKQHTWDQQILMLAFKNTFFIQQRSLIILVRFKRASLPPYIFKG